MEREPAQADRYAELPEETREFLENLRPGELKLLEDAINLMRSAQTMGKVVRWFLLLIIGSFVSMAAFGDAVTKIWSWFRGTA